MTIISVIKMTSMFYQLVGELLIFQFFNMLLMVPDGTDFPLGVVARDHNHSISLVSCHVILALEVLLMSIQSRERFAILKAKKSKPNLGLILLPRSLESRTTTNSFYSQSDANKTCHQK